MLFASICVSTAAAAVAAILLFAHSLHLSKKTILSSLHRVCASLRSNDVFALAIDTYIWSPCIHPKIVILCELKKKRTEWEIQRKINILLFLYNCFVFMISASCDFIAFAFYFVRHFFSKLKINKVDISSKYKNKINTRETARPRDRTLSNKNDSKCRIWLKNKRSLRLGHGDGGHYVCMWCCGDGDMRVVFVRSFVPSAVKRNEPKSALKWSHFLCTDPIFTSVGANSTVGNGRFS